MGATDRGGSAHRVTMADVAKAAGVSIATASYVLSGKRLSKVSPATQERVLEAARTLGYRPNRFARGLKTQRSYAIGVICSHVAFPLFGAAVAAIERVVSAHDYHVILHNTSNLVELERQALHFMEELRVDGAIFISTSRVTDNTHLADFARRAPFVALNRYVRDDFPATAVVIDHHRAGYLAARHLLERGYRRLAFLGTKIDGPNPLYASIARLEGFRRAVEEAGLSWGDVYVHLEPKGRFDAADGHRAMQQVLHILGSKLPLGVYAVNDYAAAGAVRAALEAGLRIPGDVAVVGNDDLEVASRLFPSLTSISQRLDVAGAAAATALLALLAGDAPATRHTIQPELIVRESTSGTLPPAAAPSGGTAP